MVRLVDNDDRQLTIHQLNTLFTIFKVEFNFSSSEREQKSKKAIISSH